MNDDTPTDTVTAAPDTGVPVEAVLERYAQELATMTHRALVAEALVAKLLSDAPPTP